MAPFNANVLTINSQGTLMYIHKVRKTRVYAIQINDVEGFTLNTKEKLHTCSQGDYVVFEEKGGAYPCTKAMFESTFEE